MRTKIMYCFSCYLALYLEKYLQYSIDITTEQSIRYMQFIDAKIWISKNASLCWVFTNRVTFPGITNISSTPTGWRVEGGWVATMWLAKATSSPKQAKWLPMVSFSPPHITQSS